MTRQLYYQQMHRGSYTTNKCTEAKLYHWQSHVIVSMITHDQFEWTLFITRARLLFYLIFRTRSVRFRNIYHLQMALVV